MAIAGHNQANFLHGMRRTGPKLEDYFTSAYLIDNYNVDSSGHLYRRKGIEHILTFNGVNEVLNSKTLKRLLPIKDIGFLFLFTDKTLYLYLNTPTPSFTPVICRAYRYIKRGDIFNGPFSNDAYNILSQETLTISSIRYYKDDIIAFSDAHFAPFIVKISSEGYETYPYYFFNEQPVYSCLRSVPLDIIKSLVKFPSPFPEGVLNDEGLRLYIKDIDLNNNVVSAWIDNKDRTSAVAESVLDISNVNLSKYIGKYLYFCVLPTTPISLDVSKSYNASEDFTGALLTTFNSKADIENFSGGTDADRRNLIYKFLYGRKYCLIPYENIAEISASYKVKDVYDSVGGREPSKKLSITPEALSTEKSIPLEIQNKAIYIKPRSITTVGNTYNDGTSSVPNATFTMIPTIWQVGSNSRVYVTYSRSRNTTRYRVSSTLSARGPASSTTRGTLVNVSFGGQNYSTILTRFYIGFSVDYETSITGGGTDRGRDRADDDEEDAEDVYERRASSFNRRNLKFRAAYERFFETVLLDTFREFPIRDIALKEVEGDLAFTFANNPFGTNVPTYMTITLGSVTLRGNVTYSVTDGIGSISARKSDMTVSGFPGSKSTLSDTATISFQASEGVQATPMSVITSSPTGVKQYGYEFATSTGVSAESDLYLRFNTRAVRTFKSRAVRTIAKDTNFKNLTRLAFKKDYGTNSYSLVIRNTGSRIELTGVTKIQTTYLQTVGKADLGVPVYSTVGNTFITSIPLTLANSSDIQPYEHFDSTYVYSNDVNIVFTAGSTEWFPATEKFNESIIPIYGFSRETNITYNFASGLMGDDELVTINKSGGIITGNTLLIDSGDFIAIGRQLFKDSTDNIRIGLFIILKTSSTYASSANLFLRLGLGDITTLTKVSGGSSNYVMFRSAGTLLTSGWSTTLRDTALTDISFAKTKSSTALTDSYVFDIGESATLTSKIRTKCLIYELGMFSPVKIDTTTPISRHIDGNDYDNTNTIVPYVYQGLDIKCLDGVVINSSFREDSYIYEEVWMLCQDSVHRIVLADKIYGNNYFRTLNAPASLYHRDLYIATGLRLDTIDAVSTNGLEQRYLTAKTIKDVNGVFTEYFRLYWTADSSLSYIRELEDLEGSVLTPENILHSFNMNTAFITAEEGIYALSLNSVNGIQQFNIDLMSRRHSRNEPLVLQNRLLFLDDEHNLITLTYSNERRGYAEIPVLRDQKQFLKTVNDIIYDNSQGRFYFIAPSVIYTALDINNTLYGFSQYTLKLPIIYEQCFIKNSLTCFIKQTDTYMLASYSTEDAVDFEDFMSFEHEFISSMYSNPILFSNISGYEGAFAHTAIHRIAIFEEGVEQLKLGSGNLNSEGVYYDYSILESVDNPLATSPLLKQLGAITLTETLNLSRCWVIIKQFGRKNKGTVFGFQTQADIDLGVR